MLWLGIGILVIGIALLIISVVSIKPLLKLAGVLGNIQKTTESLPNQINELTTQANNAIATGTETLHQVNLQLEKVTPLFQIIGDVGQATNKLSSTIVNKLEGNTNEESKISLKGFYGLIALVYLLFKRK